MRTMRLDLLGVGVQWSKERKERIAEEKRRAAEAERRRVAALEAADLQAQQEGLMVASMKRIEEVEVMEVNLHIDQIEKDANKEETFAIRTTRAELVHASFSQPNPHAYCLPPQRRTTTSHTVT